MRLTSFSLKTFLILSSAVLAFSCKKPGIDPIKDEGQTVIKLAASDYQLVSFDLITTPQTFNIDVRRDIPSEAELNKPMTVVIALDDAVIDAYNTDNGTSYIPLPSSSYTLDPSTPISGGNITLTFAPGEFAKNIKITVPDASTLDPNDAYALGFKVVSAEGGVVSSQLNTLVTEVGLKNKYDGKYVMTGTLVDNANAALTAKSPANVELVTTGSNSVYLRNSGTGISSFKELFPIMSAGAESAYGSFTPEFFFDAADNVTKVENAYGQPAGNTRSAAIDPSGINKYDPATHTLRVKFFMYQPSVIAGVRTYFDLTFTYTGPR